MIYHCREPRRRELVLAHPVLNGIDFVEVLDGATPAPSLRQRTLVLRFLKPAPPLHAGNVEITGGERVAGITVERVARADAASFPGEPALEALLANLPAPEHVLAVRTSAAGDFSTYELRLVIAPGSLAPPPGIDPLLSRVEFSFKVECPSDLDCLPAGACDDPVAPAPVLSYLAKDYRSFRRLMLQRMAQLLPDWRETNPADLGVTLIETLAHVADKLSYAQDAVATEAYLASARSRVSLRRHARLVDYAMHDGASARVFVHVEVSQQGLTLQAGRERFLTRLTGLDVAIAPSDEQRTLDRGPAVFEPLHDHDLAVQHNTIRFHDWGGDACCLPQGARRATLRDDDPAGPLALAPGDVVVFEERLGPRTGEPADADPLHRHAVRLCAVQAGVVDEISGRPLVEIGWADDDALPFPLCLSARLDERVGGTLVEDVSVARGNIVLCDHGRTVADEDLGSVPEPHFHLASSSAHTRCEPGQAAPKPVRFAPRLAEGPVSQVAPFDPTAGSAHASITAPSATRRPAVTLATTDVAGTHAWATRRDLLASLGSDRHVVVELERDDSARIRFGDDVNGRRPSSGSACRATYRVGNGAAGNVGAGAISHVVTSLVGIVSVRNPMVAAGGADPESMAEARRSAPFAYRRQERAVTESDYADVARRHPDVQRAVATFRWNGHGHTVFVSVDRFGGRPVAAAFRDDLTALLDRYRMAGYDVRVDAPRFVALTLDLFVCVDSAHTRAGVRQALLERLSNRALPGGRRGYFHSDERSFGDAVYLSAIYAAAMEVEGVTSVEARVFRRRDRADGVPLAAGVVPIERLEIARLDNDPNFAERGTLTLELGGGR